MKVPVPKQRLIFHGRLLIDSEKLSKYKVFFFNFIFQVNLILKKIEDGHVLHLVANPIEASSTHNQETNSLNAQTQVETRNSNNTNEIDILTGIIRTISIEIQ